MRLACSGVAATTLTIPPRKRIVGNRGDLTTAEKLDQGYLGRILMLTLLVSDIAEAVLDGWQPAELGVHLLRAGFPVEWGEQRAALD